MYSFRVALTILIAIIHRAKHLRAKDRALNNHVYPKIHYPEVYILEGGYCQYFKNSATRCQPSGYIRMDDPNHVASRNVDMDLFRKAKFGRYKSYAYGEGIFKASALSQQRQQRRDSAPNAGANPLFVAATAARTRRGRGLSVLAEDGNLTAHSDEDSDIDDSPCPSPMKTTAFKGKKIGRPPLTRAKTYGPARMAH
jgi:M-phase inducer tyrosine phosphatase